MLGGHCIKTWSVTQQAYAISSAEAELYALVEGSTRAKGILTLAKELGFGHLSNGIVLATDSSAAKQFVSRQGLGKMRHLQIRDLWLQREVSEGRIQVVKVKGDHNPADLLTKVLSVQDLAGKLGLVNIGYYSKYFGGSDGIVSGKSGIKQLDLGSVQRLLDPMAWQLWRDPGYQGGAVRQALPEIGPLKEEPGGKHEGSR